MIVDVRTPSIALALLLLSCTQSPTDPTQSPTGPMHRFTDNWIMGGDPNRTVTCIPYGETLTLQGTIVLRPFRKGLQGAILQVDANEEWILAYRAQGVLLELDGQHVEVTGRACEKQLEAVFGKHFDLATLVVLSKP